MQKGTKRKVVVFFIGLALVTLLTAAGSLAFFSASTTLAIVSVFITDAIFIVLYIVWIRLHKGYEEIYKSGLELEQEK